MLLEGLPGVRFVQAEIRSFDPERRLAFSHFSPLTGAKDAPENYNLITIDLEPDGAGTRVTLTQAKLQGEPKADESKAGESR